MKKPRLAWRSRVSASRLRMIDRQRIGIDQGLPHGFGGGDAVGERAAVDPLRQRGIAVAAGDLGDRRRRRRAASARTTTPPRTAPTSAVCQPKQRLPVPQVASTATAQANMTGNTIQAGSGFL